MRSFLFRLLILLAVIGLIAVPVVWSINADIRAAQANFASGNYATAAADYEHAARLYPWRGDLWERAGHAAYTGGDMNEAIRLFELTPALSIEGWTELGTAYFKLNRMDESIDAFQRGLNMRVAPSLYRGLVLDYNAKGDLESETAVLGNYLAFETQDAPAHYRYGLLSTLSNPGRALAELATAAKLDAAYDPAYQTMRTTLNLASIEKDEARRNIVIGRGLGLVQEWPLARETFERATIADPKNAEAWAWLGEAKQHLGQGGREELERAEALNPFSANVRALFGLYWKRMEEPKRALAEFQWAVIIEPNNPVWQSALGEAYAQSGDLPPALAAYQRATELAPTIPSFWRLLAIFTAQYSYQAANVGLPAAHQVVTLLPDDAASFDLLGWLYLSSGLMTEAETTLTRALTMDPNLASTHLHLALVYMQLEKWDLVREQLQRASDLDAGGEVGKNAAQLLSEYFP